MRNVRVLRLWGIALIAVAAVFAVPVAYGAMSEDNPAGQIGAGYVELTEEHQLSPGLIRAFVPTNSASKRCLVTLSESTLGAQALATFCGARRVDGVDGLLITMSLPESPTDLYVSMTVYQQFAKGYGAPTLYTGG